MKIALLFDEMNLTSVVIIPKAAETMEWNCKFAMVSLSPGFSF